MGGGRFKPPSDRLGTQVARNLMQPGGVRDRLTNGMFVPLDERDPVGMLGVALAATLKAEPVEQRLRKLARSGAFHALTARERLAEALQTGAISPVEFEDVARARKLKRDVIMVDDFDMALRHHDADLLDRLIF
ncbi:acyl-CoA dehydrogenase domain-containing protein [Paludibacterium denitrificans]|uniref:acyl-CoA dehydrogenase domain-containing protein n=1 Tax=Paludibacterium denitrificans TaxID=2675226 RepID=UPI0028ACEA05|nr:acyl-CoA dehydrogenase domain-containing protein [Paludibacterium denitrificans]